MNHRLHQMQLLISFDSKLVRLKDYKESISDADNIISFDSKLVRLKVKNWKGIACSAEEVSIPNWFD